MYENSCIAMVLAGGRGERLGTLTRYYAKPAVHFGSNNKIIDFTLYNCRHSGIDTIGVLTQYLSTDLHTYINVTYNDSQERGHAYMLPPKHEDETYVATADAIYKNIEFIERYRPKDVLILSGDHIYNMDYNQLIAFHRQMEADVTVASTLVPLNEASRFGILNATEDGRICGFAEKPARPKSCLASMGVYVFKWDVLKKQLLADNKDKRSRHDFGKDIIPTMLVSNESMYTYQYRGYWRDVGTLESLWAANMDLLTDTPEFQIEDIDSGYVNPVLYHTGKDRSIISRDCRVLGNIERSILADSVTVDIEAEVVDSVIMPGAYIGPNARVYKAIIGTGAKIMNHAEIGSDEGTSIFVDRSMCRSDVSLVAPWTVVPAGMRIMKNSQVYEELLQEWQVGMQPALMLERLGNLPI